MNKIKWLWTMKKPQVPLAQELHFLSIPMMCENLGIEMDLPIKHVDGDIYFGQKEVKFIFEQIRKKVVEDNNYPDLVQKKMEEDIQLLKNTITKLEKINLIGLSTKQILEYFKEGYLAIAKVTAYMSFKGTVQMSDVLEERIKQVLQIRIKNNEELTNVALLFSMPKKETFMVLEQKSILKIGIAYQQHKEIENLLLNHTKNFGWIGCVMFSGQPYSIDYFKKELQTILKDDCSKRLLEIETKKKERNEKIKTLITSLLLNKEEQKLLTQFRSWSHYRTYVKDMTSLGMVPLLPLLQELANRVQVSYNDLLYLGYSELMQVYEKKKELIFESKLRQKGWGVIMLENSIQYYNYNNIQKIKEDEEKIPSGIKGSSACKGYVQGLARIIISVEDLDSLKKGDILITSMTTTNFVPFLSKVSAIVTDEGGITCHAAIISRELNIPCIIGTRFATKAFRNGELIEVDANKGIVKKIK
ncbi:MAG: PEP-utilizing enzyme [Candidatus Woesearchaeota archaeon]